MPRKSVSKSKKKSKSSTSKEVKEEKKKKSKSSTVVVRMDPTAPPSPKHHPSQLYYAKEDESESLQGAALLDDTISALTANTIDNIANNNNTKLNASLAYSEDGGSVRAKTALSTTAAALPLVSLDLRADRDLADASLLTDGEEESSIISADHYFLEQDDDEVAYIFTDDESASPIEQLSEAESTQLNQESVLLMEKKTPGQWRQYQTERGRRVAKQLLQQARTAQTDDDASQSSMASETSLSSLILPRWTSTTLEKPKHKRKENKKDKSKTSKEGKTSKESKTSKEGKTSKDKKKKKSSKRSSSPSDTTTTSRRHRRKKSLLGRAVQKIRRKYYEPSTSPLDNVAATPPLSQSPANNSPSAVHTRNTLVDFGAWERQVASAGENSTTKNDTTEVTSSPKKTSSPKSKDTSTPSPPPKTSSPESASTPPHALTTVTNTSPVVLHATKLSFPSPEPKTPPTRLVQSLLFSPDTTETITTRAYLQDGLEYRASSDDVLEKLGLGHKAKKYLAVLRSRAGIVDDLEDLEQPIAGVLPYISISKHIWMPHYEEYVLRAVHAFQRLLLEPST